MDQDAGLAGTTGNHLLVADDSSQCGQLTLLKSEGQKGSSGYRCVLWSIWITGQTTWVQPGQKTAGDRKQWRSEVRAPASKPSRAGGSTGRLWELLLRAGVDGWWLQAPPPGLGWSIISLLLSPPVLSVNLENIEQQPGSLSEAHRAHMSSSLLLLCFFSAASRLSEAPQLLRNTFLLIWSQKEELLSPPPSKSTYAS